MAEHPADPASVIPVLAHLVAEGKATERQRAELAAFLAPQRDQALPSHATAVAEIAAERRRQVEVEGWAPEHDDAYSNGEMARAAYCYQVGRPLPWWPWAWCWWKPAGPRRNLVKAGALYQAEIDRLQRRVDQVVEQIVALDADAKDDAHG